MTSPVLSMHDLAFGYPGRSTFFTLPEWNIQAGECWGLIGPNGAGKSTLLRLLAGLLAPSRGEVRLDGHPLRQFSARDRARRIAFLPQHLHVDPAITAREVVLMGRFPHRRIGIFENPADLAVAEQALRVTGTLEFAERALATLSGGEAQRVHLAAALAQEPAVLLLDEPTASLDLHHQLRVFTILRELAAQRQLAVVAATHDVNLAARYGTRLLLLHEGRVAACGTPAEVVRPEVLTKVYNVDLTTARSPDDANAWVVPVGLSGGQP